jgi:type I restriction enzyme S subunit
MLFDSRPRASSHELPCPFPDLGQQSKILTSVNSTIKRFVELETKSLIQIEKLKEYRQSIISEAVTGKIDVRDWQLSEPQIVAD